MFATIFIYENRSQTILGYGVAVIFICQTIPKVQFEYIFVDPKHILCIIWLVETCLLVTSVSVLEG